MSVELAQEIDINQIRIDGDTQPRASLNYDTINDYAQCMNEGDIFPSIIVHYDGENYWLTDGFHRYHAAKLAGRGTIDAEIRQGDRRKAKWESYAVNRKNGMRMTSADKQKIVTEILRDPEWSQYPLAVIARHCGVDRGTVRKYQDALKWEIPTLQHINSKDVNDDHDVIQFNDGGKPQAEMPLLPFQELARKESSSLIEHPSEHAIAYAEEIAQRAYDKWLEDRGLEKNSPEAEVALREFREQNSDEEDEEEEWEPRYDGTHDAYCKYCYKTHRKWRLDEDAWLCEICSHRTADRFMQIEDVEASEEQKSFYHRHADIFETEEQEELPILNTEKERRDAHVMRVMGSSDSPEWYTPHEIVEKVLELMGTIELDPCSNSHENPKVPATTRYTKEDDGLSQQWKGKTYLNPPYGTVIGVWTNKLIESYKSGDVEEAIALLPGRIDTNWFAPLYEYLICIIKGRVQFENSPYHAPFPCVLVYLGGRRDEFIKVFSSFGPIVERIA